MLTIADLRCEYTENPLGLGTRHPRFSWRIGSSRRGTLQAGYRLLVARSRDGLLQGRADVWDSGRVDSAQSVNIEYSGPALASRERCFWAVQIWDNHGEKAASQEMAWFEVGLTDPEDWHAAWIGSPAGWCGQGLLFRCAFDIGKPVARARLYGVGLGYCEWRLNGRKVGGRVLEPDCTSYSRRIAYSTHDVTDLVQEGGNVVGAMLGNGWYGTPRLLLQLEMRFVDGTTSSVATGGSGPLRWEVASGPAVSNSIYDGEVYDARRDREGWDAPSGELDPSRSRTDGWRAAVIVDPPGGRLVPQSQEPIRVTRTLTPVALAQPQPGIWVFDIGQNIAGWVRLRVKGKPGDRVSLRFAETVNPDGTINQDNLRSARCEDVYFLKSGDLEEWEPRFTYHGFRYVQVEGYPGQPGLASIDAQVVRTDIARRGSFQCGNELINRIQTCIEWTEQNNQMGIPTDCPQRDERMGWLNDMSARAEGAIYNFETIRFFTKWLDDIADTQDPVTGAISDTAPFHWGFRPADPVCVCFLLLPWLLHVHYQDTRIMREHYDGMKRWVECLSTMARGDILEFSNWGDWAPPIHQPGQEKMGDSAVNANAPGRLISTAYWFYHAQLLSQIAEVLGNTEDRITYGALSQRIRDAFNREFWNEAHNGYGTGSQSCNAIALSLGLVPEPRHSQVVESIVREVEKHGGHLSTGNVCTKYLLDALTDGGRADVAFRIATQDTYPSWGYMIANGATTIWERWEKETGGGMNSHNHPMLCSASSWFHRALAGIRVDQTGAGFSRFTVRPFVVDGLDGASSELNTVRGVVRAGWRREGGRIVLNLAVPPNSEARVVLPTPPHRRLTQAKVDDAVVWQDGSMSTRVDGVFKIEPQGAELALRIGSGTYIIVAESATQEMRV